MFQNYFYHSTIRNYIIMFGKMFNDIEVARYDSAGNIVKSIRVPLAYGPKEHFMARMAQKDQNYAKIATQLPRLSFEIINIAYAPQREVNKMNQHYSKTQFENGTRATQFAPAPYDINMTLSGMFANIEDALQVAEQILPYFRPDWNVQMKLIPEMGDVKDIKIILNDTAISDNYEADFLSRREIVYTFTFTIHGYLFGPVRNRGMIRRTILNYSVGNTIDTTNAVTNKTVITPGLTANGTPTTSADDSIPIIEIMPDDDYGFAFEKDEYFSGTEDRT